MNEETAYKVGDKVNKKRGYKFPGTIIAVMTTLGGELRYVVEMDEFHLLHIFNHEQLTKTSLQVNL